MTLTQKETAILNDLKKDEQNCIEKYSRYSSLASDSALKTLFSDIGQKEKTHLDTICTMLSGTVPDMNSSGNDAQNKNSSSSESISAKLKNTSLSFSGDAKKNDAFLCNDALAAEKYVSGVYNTGIFEFRDENMRNALNHIQKEEQEHGKMIYDHMAANGMYNS